MLTQTLCMSDCDFCTCVSHNQRVSLLVAIEIAASSQAEHDIIIHFFELIQLV